MPSVNRNVTRTIKNSTETTVETSTPAASALAFNLTSSDKFYIGYHAPFTTRYFQFGTANATAVVPTIKYWNGSSYVTVEDIVNQTNSLRQSGFISWQNPDSAMWVKKAQTGIADVEMYWIELAVPSSLDAGCTLQSVTNIFCDDTLVRQYYPELITDTRYLPSGRNDLMEQYVAAKNYVVQRLKKDQIIEDESQIIDVNEVALAAVHATAWVVLNAFAVLEGSESAKDRADEAKQQMNEELNRVKLDFDFNDDGIISENEKNEGNVVITRG